MDSFIEDERLKSSMTIARAIALLKDKHSTKMVQRHVRALNRVAINNKSGYMLNEVSLLYELISICRDLANSCAEYEPALQRVIENCRMPFLKEKMSDEVTYAPSVIELLTLLGTMVSAGKSKRLGQHVVTSMKTLWEGIRDSSEPVDIPEDTQQCREAYITSMIERSAIAGHITRGLSDASSVQDRVNILNTLSILSESSNVNCDHILSANGSIIVAKLLSTMEDRVVFVSIEVLWNLLENGSHLLAYKQLSCYESLKIFQGLFRHLMFTSNRQSIKQTRNDLVSLLSLIASHSTTTNAPFVETGFVKDLCTFIAQINNHSINTGGAGITCSMGEFKITCHDKEDFELVKLLLCLVTSLRSLPAATDVFAEYNLLSSIFSYIVPNNPEKTKWNSAQFEEIQLLCLSCLSLLCPLSIDTFIEDQGSTQLLLLTNWCIKGDDFGSHGNSIHGNGGRGNKLSELRYCLRVLLSVCSIENNSIVLQDLHEQGIIPLLIDLLKDMMDHRDSDSKPILCDIQSDSLLILSCLCQLDNHRKELFGGYEGVPILIKYLKKDPNDFLSESGHDRLLLSAADCTWSTVVGNSVVEDIFLENGGIFCLMDLLQKCSPKMLGLVLGILVDLSDNPKSLSHMTAWQGPNSINCWSQFARLWEQEEKSLGVIRDMGGTLAGTTLPLVGAEQDAIGMPPLPTKTPSAAINDVCNNNRAKLYALCSKIGFNYPIDSMNTDEKITMCIIENYLSFKTGEVWYEVAGELAQEGLRPTTPDQEDLQEILQSFEERAEEVIKQQHELMDEQHRTDLDEEYRFYERLRDAQFSIERETERKQKLIERTSNIESLKEAKTKQQDAIEASRPSAVLLGERFHTADFSSLNVTTFSGHRVTIHSTNVKTMQDSNALTATKVK